LLTAANVIKSAAFAMIMSVYPPVCHTHESHLYVFKDNEMHHPIP